MAGSDITAKVGIDGASEFKSEIKGINGSLKTMGAEMDKVTSEFIGNENSAEALAAQNSVLAKQFDELSKKADLQRERLKTLESQGKQNSDEYIKLTGDLYKTEAAMNKTKAQIDQNTTSMDTLGNETEETAKDMDKGGESAKSFGDILKANLVSEAIIGGVKALASGIKQLGGALLDAASAADDLNTLSTVTGISTDQLQKFQYASSTIDVSVDTLAGSYSKLTKQMDAVASGSKSATAAFEKLGVSVMNDDGTFRDRNEVFQETIAALGQITDETERDAAAMDIFGKSAQDLNPLILGGAEALAEMGAHAEEAGLILSGDTLNSLAGLADRFDVLKQTASIAGQQFLAQFAEPLTGAINTVIGYVERLVGAFQSGGFKGLATEAGNVATDIMKKFTEALPKIAEFATEFIMTLVEGLVSMLPSVIESASIILTTLVTGLAESLPELIPVAVDAILTLVDTLTNPDMIGNLIDAAIAIMIALANGLIESLPELIAKAPEIIKNLVTAIVENVPKLLTASFEVIKTLATGIIDNLSQMGQAAGEIIGAIVDGVKNLFSDIWTIGKDIVMGIWQGIKDHWEWFKGQITGFFTNLVSGVKETLGIASPSKVFAGIGTNMALGLGEGFDTTMGKVERDMMSSIPIPSVNVGAGDVPVSAGGAGALGMVEEIVIPVEVGGEELARVLYRHIVGEGQRIGAAAVV